MTAARSGLEGVSITHEICEVRAAIIDMKKNGGKHIDPFVGGMEVDITDIDDACSRVDQYARMILDLRPGDKLFDKVYGPYTTQPDKVRENYPILNESTWDEDAKAYIHICGGFLAEADVAHTILDGLFPLSGGGSVYTEYVPFCPKCGKRPNFHGSPVKENPQEREELDFLR